MGHPILRQKARELRKSEVGSPELERLIDDMIETMEEYSGIGLAAPQVHQSVRLGIVGYSESNDRYPDQGQQELTVFINPKITVIDPTLQRYWEGCLSVPEMRGLVARPRKIRIDAWNREGKPFHLEAEGFLATVFQHEFDHLDGVLYIDRLVDTRHLAFTEEYQRFLAESEIQADGDLGD